MATTWYCLKCDGQEGQDRPEWASGKELLAHADQAHGISLEQANSSSGSLVEALDGPNYYRNTYQFTLPGEEKPWAVRVDEAERDADDPMRDGG